MFVCSRCNQQRPDDERAGDYPGHDPICFNCFASDWDTLNGVEVLYRSRDLKDDNQTSFKGYHIKEIIDFVEQRRDRGQWRRHRSGCQRFEFKNENDVASIVVVDGRGGTRLFVPEKDR